jgi:hypothetical protein
MVAFVALSEAVRDLAYKHMKRSGRYARQNNFECADGSAAKAARKFQQAEALETPPLDRACQLLMLEIETRIMMGEVLAD